MLFVIRVMSRFLLSQLEVVIGVYSFKIEYLLYIFKGEINKFMYSLLHFKIKLLDE